MVKQFRCTVWWGEGEEEEGDLNWRTELLVEQHNGDNKVNSFADLLLGVTLTVGTGTSTTFNGIIFMSVLV